MRMITVMVQFIIVMINGRMPNLRTHGAVWGLKQSVDRCTLFRVGSQASEIRLTETFSLVSVHIKY